MGVYSKVTQVTASLSSEDSFSDSLGLYYKESAVSGPATGYINVSITGAWEGKITVQRKPKDGSKWRDVATYESNCEKQAWDYEFGIKYRIGFKKGNYVSGTAEVRLATS